IPLLLALIGIIIRGSSFTFRYYDIPDKKVNEYYTKFFRISSMLTPFFFGIVMGAVILGRIPATPEGSFYDAYVRPWFNLFPIITGMFVTILFAWLASVFLVGEVSEKDQSTRDYAQISNFLLVILICLGLLVFIIAEIDGVHLLKQFSKSYISIGSLILASVLVPLIWKNVKKHNIIIIRILAGAIALCILLGWFGIQLPVLVYISEGEDLTVWNSIAPEPTIRYLVYALIGGILIIFPSIAYLYKVFKFKKT
ncbi:MAG TPA: cytochrome d ubiquinol oxidase subunit II, partial [Bacteroidales bacterium]|nr:cytochrome d ubiquinol oxidase subunit II [Bacteroidales bacterium]